MVGVNRALPWIYRALWLVVFAAGVASAAYLNPRNEAASIRLFGAGHAVGFAAYIRQGPEGLLGGPYGAAGGRAGFREGDVILVIDGHRVPFNMERRIALLDGAPGSVATLVLRHADGTPATIRVRRDPEVETRAYAGTGITYAIQRWMTFAVETLAVVAALVAALLLFLRRPGDPVAQLLSAALVLTNAGVIQSLPGLPPLLILLLYLTANSALWLAILLFPDGRFATRWHLPAFGALVGVSIVDVVQWSYSLSSDWAIALHLLQSALTLIAIVRQLHLTPPGIRRQQSKFVLFGIAAYCLFFIAASVLVPAELMVADVAVSGWITFVKRLFYALATVAIPAGLLVSLLRYRLYDAETAISRSVAYGALTVALIAVFAASEKMVEILSEGYVGQQLGTLSGAIAAAIAAASIAPLHHRVTRWAERRFQGDLVHLRHGLPLLVDDLRETATPAALADAVLVRLEKGARASHGAVVAGGALIACRDIAADRVREWLATIGAAPERPARLEVDRADPVFPMRVPLRADGVGPVGWLLLGPRPDGSFYGKDERETLASIADPVARALAIAVERDRREAERQQRDTATRQTLEALCRFVHERFGVDVTARGTAIAEATATATPSPIPGGAPAPA